MRWWEQNTDLDIPTWQRWWAWHKVPIQHLDGTDLWQKAQFERNTTLWVRWEWVERGRFRDDPESIHSHWQYRLPKSETTHHGLVYSGDMRGL